jgi:transposase
METLTLTTRQRRRLELQLRNTRDARVLRRTLAVLEVAQGGSVSVVARLLRVTPRVVYYWIEAYAQGFHPDVLHDRDRSGRPKLLTPKDRNHILELLKRSPQDLGYFATEWTVGLLQYHLERCTGQHYSEDTLRRELHQLDYVWKRPRYILDPDPEVTKKKAADPPANQAVAAAQCGVGGGRNRSIAVPVVTGGVVAPRSRQARVALWSQCPKDGVWSAKPAHGATTVPAARASTGS